MSYPFVASFHDYGPREFRIDPLHPVVHMAEGGGTVGYLSRKNPNGVSVHYVIEYTGRVVQMLREDHINGSLNPNLVRTTDDRPYRIGGEVVTYGATAARDALGTWWKDPNRATIGIEIEGFAAEGPNGKQATALTRLIAEIRTRYPGAHALAHRDFADYKACPGKNINWPALGGHGTPHQQEEEVGPDWYMISAADGTVDVQPKRGLINLVTYEAVVPSEDTTLRFRVLGRGALRQPFGGVGGDERRKGYITNYGPKGEAVVHLVLDDVIVPGSYIPTVTTPDPTPVAYDVQVTVGGKTPVDGQVVLP